MNTGKDHQFQLVVSAEMPAAEDAKQRQRAPAPTCWRGTIQLNGTDEQLRVVVVPDAVLERVTRLLQQAQDRTRLETRENRQVLDTMKHLLGRAA